MRILKPFSLLLVSCLVTLTTMIIWVSNASAYDTKSNRENRVRVEVRPVKLAPGEPAKFEVRMNTHSVNLSQDMVAASLCRDDQGREYRPVSWQGSPPGGHHRSGILEFPTLEGNLNGITLVIMDIANVPERNFEWKLEWEEEVYHVHAFFLGSNHARRPVLPGKVASQLIGSSPEPSFAGRYR